MKYDLPSDPLQRLLRIVEILRSPEGCPWDREQDHRTIKSNLIEESYEVLEAIDAEDGALLKEELGDLLLQVVFHTQLEKEKKAFEFCDVAQVIGDKLIRRHPHVFENAYAPDTETVLKNWNELKKKEKPERTGFFDGIPLVFPALMRSQEVQKKAAKTGFDWDNRFAVLEKVKEELAELEEEMVNQGSQERINEELGDLLLVICNLARHLKLDAEESCRQGTLKFQHRFEVLKNYLEREGRPMESFSVKEMGEAWVNVAKKSKIMK
ncbi:MAG: nucleoside triphosphate pyrophosphohydrolase [Verrucomicrobiota bacterium]